MTPTTPTRPTPPRPPQPTRTRPSTGSRAPRALGALLLGLVVAATAGCGGDGEPAAGGTPAASTAGSAPAPGAPSGTAAEAPPGAAPPGDTPSTAAPAAPSAAGVPSGTAPAPSAAAAAPPAAAGAGAVVQDGVRVQVPAGWQVTALTPAAQAEALAREPDARVGEFLRTRFEGLAAQGAVLYLYDLRRVASGELATAEVYRYPLGRTSQQVLEETVLPRLQQAGLPAVRGQAVLPAGTALTATVQTQASGRDLRNEVFVLPLGPTTVGLSVTTVGAAQSDAPALAQSLAVG